MDFYRDYFTRESLTDAVVKTQFTPGQAQPLFETRAIASTTLAIEELPANDVTTLAAIPRGSPLPAMQLDKRRVVTFPLNTYGRQTAIYADEVLNMRAAGATLGAEMITIRRDAAVANLRRQMDMVHEKERMNCLLNPDNAFGSHPAEAAIAFSLDATKTRAEFYNKIIKIIETQLGGIPFTGIKTLCGDDFWTALIENKSIKDTFYNSQQVAVLRNEPRDDFEFAAISFSRYRGAAAMGLAANKAIAIPLGVPGLLIQAFGPDDTIDSVGQGQIGAPYYLRAFDLDDAKGWRIRAQTHCAMVCTRPQVLVPLSFT